MRVLLVHPSALMYSEIFLRLEPLGLERVGAAALADGQTTGIVGRQLLCGQTNFARMIWKFNKVYNADRQYSDHLRDVEYLLPPPKDHRAGTVDRKDLYIHAPVRRRS